MNELSNPVMSVRRTTLNGVVEVLPKQVRDARGWFIEAFNVGAMADAGLPTEYAQDNESVSLDTGTLRGLHFQLEPFTQPKLVRVVHGSIYDVAVDLRRSSPTFGEYVGITLTADASNQMFVPAGFGHGFITLEPNCRVAYKVGGVYRPDHARAVKWDDPQINIDWPIEPTIVSDKDRDAPLLADAPDLFT